MLRLIWLGRLKDCADLPAQAAFGQYQDRHTQLCASRALIETGDDALKRRYAAYICQNCGTLPKPVVWEAVDGLFPHQLGVDDLLSILSRVDATDRGDGLGFEWYGPRLVERVESPAELERLLTGLLGRLGGSSGGLYRPLDSSENAYFPGIAAAAHRVLARCSEHQASTAAIDAALRLGEHRQFRNSAQKAVNDLGEELHRNAARRRFAFWRAADRLTLRGRSIQSIWEMEVLGYSPGLLTEDVEWLLADAPTRTAEHERRLAIDGAMTIWRRSNGSADLLARIEAAARTDPSMSQVYNEWTQPQAPSPELRKSERELRKAQRRNAIAQAKRDKSWIDFVNQLREGPEPLRQFRPTSSEGADSRLFHLWQLLKAALGNRPQFAIDTVAPLEPMLGAELARVEHDGIRRSETRSVISTAWASPGSP